jgi:hypothetical protein
MEAARRSLEGRPSGITSGGDYSQQTWMTIPWVEMPSNWEKKEARKSLLESGEEGLTRCDKAGRNNQPKVSAGTNEVGKIRLVITKREDQQSKPVDARTDEPDGRIMKEPPSLATPFLLL